jgi:hypothetical protein
MNLFTKIIDDVKSFAAKAELELAKIFGEAPKLEAIASAVLKYVGPLLETVVSVVDAPLAPLLTAGINKAQADLFVAQALTQQIGLTPSVTAILSGVSADLPALLAAAQITNPATIKTVGTVINELEVLVKAATPAVTAAS